MLPGKSIPTFLMNLLLPSSEQKVLSEEGGISFSESLAALYQTMYHKPENGNFKKPGHWNLQMF